MHEPAPTGPQCDLLEGAGRPAWQWCGQACGDWLREEWAVLGLRGPPLCLREGSAHCLAGLGRVQGHQLGDDVVSASQRKWLAFVFHPVGNGT